MIYQYIGTIGSGKSYHALEVILAALEKGKFVLANFPLKFTDGMIRKGYADKFMYVPDEFLLGTKGVSFLFQLSKKMEFYEKYGEGACLVVIDEAGNHYPPEENSSYSQRLWKTFYTQSRKLGFDFILVCQEDKQINRTIRSCVEYKVIHRKANNVAPFKWLPFTIFMYVTFWAQTKQRLNSSSTIFVKRFAALYNTDQLFGNAEQKFELDLSELVDLNLDFGNCKTEVEDHDEDKKNRFKNRGIFGRLTKKTS
ncbi:zonular occludens toxin domain-containing protein [Schinkia azotoformans]|uniref:zonular occludens toxin domain-containing protein n=1 Tax=Schinkia azotoformans TaxID=1454 RepID=UPI003D26C0C8